MNPLKYRPRNGRVPWDSREVKQRIHAALEQGITLVELAHAWGMKPCTVQHHVAVRALNALPGDRLSINEAADTLNLTPIGVHALCRRQGVQMGRWGKLRTLTREQLATLAQRETIVHERPSGYVTAAELVKAWGMTDTAVRHRLQGVPRLALMGDGPRVKFIYHLRDVTPRAPRVGPRAAPAGMMGVGELAAILGIAPAIVSAWGSTLGAPSIKGRKNRYYNPAALAGWLQSSRQAHMRAYGHRLTAHLTQRQAA